MSIKVIDVFVKLREMLLTHKYILLKPERTVVLGDKGSKDRSGNG